MSLMSPTFGEVEDRMSILLLKIRFGLAQGRGVSHFEKEFADLTAWAFENLPDSDDEVNWRAYTRAAAELQIVNLLLWQETDRQQGLVASSSPYDGLDCAMRLHELNSERYALRAEIDAACGVVAGPEKL